MSGDHEQIWNEVNSIRDRVHSLGAEVSKHQHFGNDIERVSKSLEDHKVDDVKKHEALAVVENDVAFLKEMERGRLVKFSIIVGIIVAAMQVGGWLLSLIGKH